MYFCIPKAHAMKPNLYQKYVILVFLTLLVFLCVFFLPFTNKKEVKVYHYEYRTEYFISYQPIWNAEGVISTPRLVIELFVLIVLSGGLFYFLGTISEERISKDFESRNKIIKREIIFILLSILLIVGAFYFYKIAYYSFKVYYDVNYNVRVLAIVIIVCLLLLRYVYYLFRSGNKNFKKSQ